MAFRVLLFNAAGNPEGELSKDAGTLDSCTRSEEINAEHSLTIRTVRHLEVGTRALTYHADGRWREWVVDEPGETHDTGEHAVGTYHMCWSLQYDLQANYGSVKELGMVVPATVRQAIVAALDGTRRWECGTTDVTTKASSVVMNSNESSWDRITTIVKRWGGEVDADIQVNELGVKSRKVVINNHLGSTMANRRFEWGHDLTSITRTPDPGPYFCRIIPLGSGEGEQAADGQTTYDVYLDITKRPYYNDSATGIRHDSGSKFLRDTQSELVFRVSDGKGGYEYPHTVVSFTTDDDEELFELGKEDILRQTRPKVSYSGSVANFAEAGMNVDGLQLGDEVQVIDLGFNPEAELRIQERIIKMDIDELGIDDAKLSIGRLTPTLERNIATIINTVGAADISHHAPQWDASRYPTTTPDLSLYEVTKPSSPGISYTVPTYNVDIPDYSSAISGLTDRVSSLEGGSVYGGGASSIDYDGGGSVGGDGIVHQFNGVTMNAGTINFTTVGSGSSSSSDSSSDDERVPFAPEGWGKTSGMGRSKVFPSSSWGSGS